uniref:Secreted protein n=1 Tax=Steinernema glaseri TaxID=37863 RepID=A0A1I7YGN8_9BILA
MRLARPCAATRVTVVCSTLPAAPLFMSERKQLGAKIVVRWSSSFFCAHPHKVRKRFQRFNKDLLRFSIRSCSYNNAVPPKTVAEETERPCCQGNEALLA